MDEYISKEFMLKNLEADKMNNAEHCEPVTVQIMERFIRYVKEFPSADVQPIKHGRWTWDSNAPHREHGAYKCSNCGCHSDFEENYCYNCGARMMKDGDTDA